MESMFKQVVENAPDAVLMHLGGEITYANRAACNLFGASISNELIGLLVANIIEPASTNGAHDLLLTNLDGAQFQCGATVQRLDNGEGELTTIFLHAGDQASRQAAAERDRLITELSQALADVETLSGLLPICAACKKIRVDEDYWQQIEGYIMEHSGAEFTHGICPDCADKMYREIASKAK